MELKQQAPYPLRMPPEMRKRLEVIAEHRKRSLNAEIVAAIEEADKLRHDRDMAQADLKDVARQLQESYKREREAKAAGAQDTEALKLALDAQKQAMRSNRMLLRAMADFVILRHHHPEVSAHMEEPILNMATAVQATEDDAKLMEAAAPAFKEYMQRLVDAVNEVTKLLGPGWASKRGNTSAVAETKSDVHTLKPKKPKS